MRKADLYIRVSTDEQADKVCSQRDQEDRLRKYCETKGNWGKECLPWRSFNQIF